MNKVRSSFQSHFSDVSEHVGKPFVIVGALFVPDENHDAEVLPMFWVQFDDGVVQEAHPEEVFELD